MIQLPSSALDQLLTPCLVVDVPAASRNIRRCAAFFSGQSAALRPHFKAHKCTTLMREQLAAGGCAGVACQTSWEAEQITRQEGLSFRGLQAYEGHAVHRDSREVRATLVQQAALQIQHEQARLAAAGFDCEVISGGGTGTYDLAAQAGALTEIQAGSYVLMDGRYGTLDLPFEPALYCVTTVISRRPSRAVLNAGLKELTAEYGMPVIQAAGARVTALSDEHAQVSLTAEPGALAVGDKVLLIPAHVDPAVNLYDRLFAWSGTEFTEWEVDGRRRYRLPGPPAG